jgi:hypothetical protein
MYVLTNCKGCLGLWPPPTITWMAIFFKVFEGQDWCSPHASLKCSHFWWNMMWEKKKKKSLKIPEKYHLKIERVFFLDSLNCLILIFSSCHLCLIFHIGATLLYVDILYGVDQTSLSKRLFAKRESSLVQALHLSSVKGLNTKLTRSK